jgi:hypothetical protein
MAPLANQHFAGVRFSRLRRDSPPCLCGVVLDGKMDSCCKIPISNNVGGVKQFSSTRPHALIEERHSGLEDGFARFQPGLAFNRWGQELSPTQPSLRSPTAIMITCSNSPVRGAGCPIITSVIYCTPSGFPGAPACEPSFPNWP